jgi:hypothetical protein
VPSPLEARLQALPARLAHVTEEALVAGLAGADEEDVLVVVSRGTSLPLVGTRDQDEGPRDPAKAIDLAATPVFESHLLVGALPS